MGSNTTSWCWKKSGIFGRERCIEAHFNDNSSAFTGFCPPVWDGFLCWPPTAPGSTIQLECPRKSGNDVTKFAFRICQANGTWNQSPNRVNFSADGWTNYWPCFNNYTLDLMKKLLGSSNSTEELTAKTNIAAYVRVLEMVGLVVSALSLIAALIIFGRFRNLWNNRTRIHRNLFVAMTIQVLARLVVYIDQYIDRRLDFECYTLQRMEYTCESAYTILEYAKTSMFLWMFIEGLYLHNMITVAVFQEHLSRSFYYVVGWGAPIILTSIWAIITANEFHGVTCWLGYNFSSTYMVLEGPRLVVIFLNLLFLLNIMRVLVTKLRESNSTEAQQVRKAVRAAIVLLPLLGITNSIQMVHSPLEKSTLEFATWSYGTAFLSTFQGFFCSLIYCFLNGEVQIQVKRYFRTAWHGKSDIPRRKSFGASVINHINVNVLRANGEDKGRGGELRTTPKLSKAAKTKLNEMKTVAASGHDASGSQSGKDNHIADPFYENWDEVELSSHNNVIIELVEIPHDSVIIPIQGGDQVRFGKVTNSPARISSGSVTNIIAGTNGLHHLNEVVIVEEERLKNNRSESRIMLRKGDGESGSGNENNIDGISRMADDAETDVESDYE